MRLHARCARTTRGGWDARWSATEVLNDGVCEPGGAHRRLYIAALLANNILWKCLPIFECGENRIFHLVCKIKFANVAKHHGGGEDESGWVNDVLPGVLWRRAVDGLKDCHLVTVVCARCEAEAANESGCKVADDVAVQVGCDDHVKLRGIFHHLVRDVVNDEVVRLNRRVLCRELFANPLEHSFRELQDVRLARCRYLLAVLPKRKLIGKANDLFRTLSRDQLDRLSNVMRLQMFNTSVEIFNVFAHDHHVDPFALVARWDPWKFARGAHVGVRLKEFAQRDVGAFLAESDWCL